MDITASLYVNSIVQDALRLLRIATPFQRPTGDDESQAVLLINEILSEMNASESTIPFYYDIPFQTESGKKKYYFGEGSLADVQTPYFVDVPYIVIDYNDVQFPVRIIKDMQALSTMRPNSLQVIPSEARFYKENDDAGNTYGIIDFYYAPDSVYNVTARVKPFIGQVTYTSTITILPQYYRTYLKLELACRLTDYYGLENMWTQKLMQQHAEAKRLIMAAVEVDLSVNPDSSLLQNSNLWYGWNLGVQTNG